MSVKYSCQIVARLLGAHGIEVVVMSPGSRNAPLMAAIDHEACFKTFNVIDERSAAFMALGIAQSSRKPVALICTSGTALLNYAPAVAEAFYQHIPLVLITADRPKQWIDQDDSQTIRQPGALSNFVKYSCDLPDFNDPADELCWYAGRCMNEALLASVSPDAGPVHVNVQLSEPLLASYPKLEKINAVKMMQGVATFPKEQLEQLADELHGKRVMLVAGFMQPDSRLIKAVSKLASLPSVVVLAESLSNLHCAAAINTVDRVLKLIDKADASLHPQVVISIGGALVSRHLKTYLRSIPELRHWSIGAGAVGADVFRHLSLRVNALPQDFLPALADILVRRHCESNYRSLWHSVLERDNAVHAEILKNAPWSALKFFEILWPQIPPRTNLQLSNGTAVRYAQLFYNPLINASYCNRGVSGIDGCGSTAVGASLGYAGQTLLITGDMSFAYDINALSLPVSERLKIIIINNSGGGIFRFIASTRNADNLEKNFCVNPNLDFHKVADTFEIRFFSASDQDEFTAVLPEFFAFTGKAMLEVKVAPDIDAQAIINYFSH